MRFALVLSQRIVGENDRHGLVLQVSQRTQHTETGTLLQMQIKDHHVDLFGCGEFHGRPFRIHGANRIDILELIEQLAQAVRQYGRIFYQKNIQGLGLNRH